MKAVSALRWMAALAFAAAATQADEDRMLLGRYPNWARYAGFPAEQVPFQYLTHLLYASFASDAGGVVLNSDPLDQGNFLALARLAKEKGVKLSLSIDAAGTGTPFDAMAAKPGARDRFIRNCLSLADRHGLDGIDFAWDFRSSGDGDRRLMLLREMRAALDKHPRKLLLTSQVSASDRWAGRLSDEFFTLPDFLVVTVSDYEGSRDRLVAPVGGLEESRAALRYFEKRGVPAARLVLESPFFGRSFDGASGLGSRYFGKGSGNGGAWRWKDLLEHLRKAEFKISWDAASKSEVAVGDRETIVFNGIPSQRARGELIRSGEWAGAAALDLPSDTLEEGKSLLVALHRGLRGMAKPPLGPSKPAALPAASVSHLLPWAGEPGSSPAGGAPAVVAEWVSDHLAPGALLEARPLDAAHPLPSLTDTTAREGRFSLEVRLRGDEESACSVCLPSPLNLVGAFPGGLLEFWVRGASGDEAFDIGLRDDGVNGARRPLTVRVNSRSFSVIKRGEWIRLRIPLRAFGTRGSYTTARRGQAAGTAYNAFHWSGVRCLSLEIEKGRQKEFRVWIDGLRISTSDPAASAPAFVGRGYTTSNDTRIDLPGWGS